MSGNGTQTALVYTPQRIRMKSGCWYSIQQQSERRLNHLVCRLLRRTCSIYIYSTLGSRRNSSRADGCCNATWYHVGKPRRMQIHMSSTKLRNTFLHTLLFQRCSSTWSRESLLRLFTPLAESILMDHSRNEIHIPSSFQSSPLTYS